MFGKVGTFFYELSRAILKLVSNGYGIKRIGIDGKEFKTKASSPVVIVGNHVSFTDPLFFAGLYPKRKLTFIASELVMNDEHKVRSFLLHYAGCIKLNREIYDIEGIRKATDALKKGYSLLIYPEGTLKHGNDSQLEEIKAGAILLAVQAGVPIIPTYSLKRDHWYGRRIVVVGEEFKISDYSERRFPTVPEMNTIAEALVSKMNECRDVYEKYVSSK